MTVLRAIAHLKDNLKSFFSMNENDLLAFNMTTNF